MEAHNYLGIYLSPTSADVVCLNRAKDHKIQHAFTVSIDNSEKQESDNWPQELAQKISDECNHRKLAFTNVSIALDCSLFMQHDIHSEFSDNKQIAATVRFDTEEALATDVSQTAIAFKVASKDQTGSNLHVFSARKKELSKIIKAFQSKNMDPVRVEPDIMCLGRSLNPPISSHSDSSPNDRLFGILSKRNAYFLSFSDQQSEYICRTFLLGENTNHTARLTREIPITAGLAEPDQSINDVVLCDSTGQTDIQQLNHKTGMNITSLDLSRQIDPDSAVLDNESDTVGYAIAFGAAISYNDKTTNISFRPDFMPYQGRKARIERFVKMTCVGLIVLFVALGIYGTTLVSKANQPVKQLRQKFEKEFSTVMMGQSRPDDPEDALNDLKREWRRVKNLKSGQLSASGEKSISAKLTTVLTAFNSVASQVDLNIQEVSITSRDIRIIGDTSSRRNTLDLFQAVRNQGLEITQQRLDPEGGRDKFQVSVRI